MTFSTETIAPVREPGFLSRLYAGFSALIIRMMDAQDRSGSVHRLQRCSDAELAKMGISRQDIVRHVFRDVYFL